jgi:molybdate transport repressor ModE-like protein
MSLEKMTTWRSAEDGRRSVNPPLEVSRLRLLREVALRGSIAGAAREVGLTPSAVSQQLAILEREAGTALLDRSPRGVLLTGAGHALVDRATAILQLLEEARSDLDRNGRLGRRSSCQRGGNPALRRPRRARADRDRF